MIHLVLTLHAPLAAFGAVAVGERRPGWDRPGRSAVLGLVAAAMGIEREDEAGHLALERGYGLAVRTDAPGRLLVDYHTAQVPPARRGRRLATRAEELREKLETVLTRREYRTDALHVAALWARPEAPHRLETLRDALLRPVFALYVGRKSCPLGLPLDPVLIEAHSPPEAMTLRVPKGPETALRRAVRASPGPVALGAEDAREFGLDAARVESRRDRLASRRRWQFALREEAVLRVPGQGG